MSDFRIDNLTIIDQRYWAIALMFSRRGTISNMRFKLQRRIRGDWRVWRNQDGIDLRSGCNNILIENIMGETGDDCIALTDLMNEKSPEYNHKVEGKSSDIHDVIIRNVRCITNMCNVIRLLNQYEHKIYNITMDNIIDAGTPGLESIAQSVIALGDDAYYRDEKDRAKKGSMYNISINNVYSRSMTAVHLEMTVKNIHINNVFVHSDGQYAVTFGKWGLKDSIFFFAPDLYEEQSNLSLIPKKDTTTLTAENVLIENIYYTAKSTAENFTPAICAVHNSELENVTVRNISCGDDVKLLHTTSDSDNIYGLTISK